LGARENFQHFLLVLGLSFLALRGLDHFQCEMAGL
jgi:hypothetical protein